MLINFVFNDLFCRCVYSDDDITALENKLIKSINVDSNLKKLPTIDLYEFKRISCDINPLYYSLAHCEDFSSSEFSDFEQCTYDDIESVLNQAIIANSSYDIMEINSTNSIESHRSNSACKEPTIITNGDSYLDEKCSVNSDIGVSDIGNKVKIVNNLNSQQQYNSIKKPNTSDDINSFSNLEHVIECNNILDSSNNIQNNKISSSVIVNVKNYSKDCKPFSSNINDINGDNTSFSDDKTVKMIQETDDNLDVVSPHNFETFTVIENNNENGDIFCTYNDDTNLHKTKHDTLKSESVGFQTFTVINENMIIDDDDSQKDINVNIKGFEHETSDDFKTFTVFSKMNSSPFNVEPICSSSSSMLTNSNVYINNNDILDLDPFRPTHTLSQFDTITLLPQSTSHINEVKEVSIDDLIKPPINDGKECNISELDIVCTQKENFMHNESCNQLDLMSEENTSLEVINHSHNVESSVTSNDSSPCTNMKQISDVVPNKLDIIDDNSTLNFVSEDSNSQSSNNLSHQHLEKLKSSGESDSTLSLHLEIFENNKGMNSPDSLNEDEVFGHEEKPVVSNKLEFVPLETTLIKDNRSPRLSRKYMECSPVISANAYIPEVENSSIIEENSERKNSSSFFIDFNEGKPKNRPKRFENLTKSLDSSTIATNKEKIFSMFIDFNEDSESSESSSKGSKLRKPQTLADRFVRMHSEETSVKSNEREDTVTPPPSRMTSTVENSSVDISESCKKQSVFMFIENDSPTPVKRRSLPQGSRLKSQRNSWNVDSTVVHKTHHRTHSVNSYDENHLDVRMTQSHIETESREFIKSSNSFDKVECNVTVTVNGAKDSGIGLTDSFVRLSDMDKAPSQEIISSLNKCESKSESLRRDLKNTELGRCLKRMFPYLKSTEVERILLSKPPHSLDSKEEIKTNLGQDLLRMFLEEIGADTTIDINGRRIKAHKCVLTSRCQYFAAMFSGGWVQSAGNVLYLKG